MSMLQRFAYGLDLNGNRTNVTVTGTAIPNGTETYVYDDLDRLTGATYIGGGTASYAYDANGNRISVISGATTTYTYDDADQLTAVGGTVLTYDDNGNRLTAGSDAYSYDWNNRLDSATVGGTTVDYTYAGDDLRASATVGSTTTSYLWDRETGLAELLDDGTTSYLQTGQGLLAEVDASNDATYPLADALGSVRTRTDGTGAVVGAAEYDAFGNLRSSSGTQGTMGWTGELRDPTTGLTYLRARDYAPGVGRFLTRDTVNPSGPGTQGYNVYAYAGNNPVTLTD